jgi:hypothetical protein
MTIQCALVLALCPACASAEDASPILRLHLSASANLSSTEASTAVLGAFEKIRYRCSQGMTPAAFQLRRLARFFEDRPTAFRCKRLGCT